jgi:hypothetical protein
LPHSFPTGSAQWQLALAAELHATCRAGAAPEIFRAAQDGLPIEQCLWQGPLPFGSVELPLDGCMGAIGSAILHQIPILLEAIGCQGFEDLFHAQVSNLAPRSAGQDGGTASTDESNGLLFLSFIMQASQSATIHTPSNGRDRLFFYGFQSCDVRTHKISGAVLKGECMLAVQVRPQTGSGVVAAGSAAAVPRDPLHNPPIFQEQCIHARLCVAAPRATFKGTVAGWIRDAGHAVG